MYNFQYIVYIKRIKQKLILKSIILFLWVRTRHTGLYIRAFKRLGYKKLNALLGKRAGVTLQKKKKTYILRTF